MTRYAFASLILALTSHSLALAVNDLAAPSKPFPHASVRFEQNATDGDVEVVFEVTGRSEGLAQLAVTAPDGRTVVDFKAPDASTLGIRQFIFESPEPTDVAGLKAAYPEGTYTFQGATASGAQLRGKVTLKHELPVATSFVSPKANGSNVPINDLKIEWAPVNGMAGYIVELEQDGLDVKLTARLSASEPKFAVPDGFLRPGTEYQLGIGTVSDDGNISYVETNFTTATE
ncbi:MAG: hypothetical protein WD738_15265 [Pirellulales bacterium]